LTILTQQVHLDGQWKGKKHHVVLPLDGQEVITLSYFSPFFKFAANACLGISSLMVIFAILLAAHKTSAD
jgi:hypothetical protein